MGPDDKSTINHMIDVMSAYRDGFDIEYRHEDKNIWNTVNEPTWDWSKYVYRVKPKPRTFYILFVMGYQLVFCDEPSVKEYLKNILSNAKYELIEVKEVIK